MMKNTRTPVPAHRALPSRFALALIGAGLLSACTVPQVQDGALPVLGAAQPARAKADACASLAARFKHAGTEIVSTSVVAQGAFTVAGVSAPSPEHCLVAGRMNARTGLIDSKPYAIGFEMRLPTEWNGRFYYQANGGLDGNVVPAAGNMLGGAPVRTALHQGFAVISSDAGHPASAGPFFGLDPQARLDYGYNAVAQLTPMAKALIQSVYGKGPDRSYLAGCSNGGRHAMVAASRFADQYDGILAGNPGFNLPKAAVAQLYGAKQYASIASKGANGQPDFNTAVSPAEWGLLARKVSEKCDALDGLSDGLIGDTAACQKAFSIERDVPTCSGGKGDGSCLSAAQKTVLGNIFKGARNSSGQALYNSFPWDSGVGANNYRFWEYTAAQNLDPGAVAFIFMTPPASFKEFVSASGLQYALNFNLDTDAPKIFATDSTYTTSSMAFMTPPSPHDLSRLRQRGGKMMVFHGVSDAVFSSNDTAGWYEKLNAAHGGKAGQFARYFQVPGMNHCSGGPTTDQFDMVTPLVQWVEQGKAPDQVLAQARGAGANVVNAELPAAWAANRSRPLCPYPKLARYKGTGSIESAESFSCQ